MSKYLLFVNDQSGRSKRGTELDNLLEATRQVPHLTVHAIRPTDDLPAIVRRAIKDGVKVVGAAGGDGTINLVAATLVDTKIPLVVVPFGTLNHFARDLELSDSPLDALKLFEEGEELTIDVGEVNGHYFLNNSSVGIYPLLVQRRDHYKDHLGKPLASVLAAWEILRHPRLIRVKLDMEGNVSNIKAGIIFFSNNRADMTPLQAGHRPRLDGQILDAYIVRATNLFQFLRVTYFFLRNKLENSPLITKTEVPAVTVYAHEHTLRVACDGEVFRIPSPLHYRIRPAALVVRVSSESVFSINKSNS